MPNDSDVQASIRAITGTAWDYNGDWSALFDLQGIPAGAFNERMLNLLNSALSTTYTSLPAAQNAYAAQYGFPSWSAVNSITVFSTWLLATGVIATGKWRDDALWTSTDLYNAGQLWSDGQWNDAKVW